MVVAGRCSTGTCRHGALQHRFDLTGVPPRSYRRVRPRSSPSRRGSARPERQRRRIDGTFIRTCDDARYIPAHPDARLCWAASSTGLKRSRRLRNRAVDILAARKPRRPSREHCDLAGPRVHGRLKAFQIRHQHRVRHAGTSTNPAQNVHMVRHLRNPFWATRTRSPR